MVADDAKRGGDRNCEQQAHAAPDPSPEEERDGDGNGVETHAATDKRGRDEIRGDHMDRCNTPAISRNEPNVLIFAEAMMNAGAQAMTAPM